MGTSRALAISCALCGCIVAGDAVSFGQQADGPTGRVWSCDFATERFAPPRSHADDVASRAFLAVAKRVNTVAEESSAVPWGMEVLYWAPKLTGNQLFDDPKGTLVTLMNAAYATIMRDSAFDSAGSALGFCIAGARAGRGHGFAYIPYNSPPAADGRRPSIVFLHGYGGNLLWNMWALKTLFPGSVILAPSGGVFWPDVPAEQIQEYIDEMCGHVEKTLHCRLDRPWLMALSQGGPTGFRLSAADPDRYSGYVSIASWADEPDRLRYPKQFPILMINGTDDQRVPMADARHSFEVLSRSGASVSLESIENADHFFFLSRREEMGRIIRGFVRKHLRVEHLPVADIRMSDCVGRYLWQNAERNIDFRLEADGSFTAHQTPNQRRIDEGMGLVSSGRGRWTLQDRRLTIRMDAVHVFGAAVPHEVAWIDQERIREVGENGISLVNGDRLERP